MGKKANLKQKLENGNTNIEIDADMVKLKEQLRASFGDYQKTMLYMSGDAPIGVLCLPRSIEKILLDQGFLRVYDLFNADLVKIEGLTVPRVKQLAARLDQFFSMCR